MSSQRSTTGISSNRFAKSQRGEVAPSGLVADGRAFVEPAVADIGVGRRGLEGTPLSQLLKP